MILAAILCQCAGPSTRFDCSWFSIAGWLNRQQRDAIDYLREENRVLREQLDDKRLRLNDDQRRRLAQPTGDGGDQQSKRVEGPAYWHGIAAKIIVKGPRNGMI